MRKIFSFLSPLFDPKRFIEEITQKLPHNVGVSFINKKARFIDHTVYIYPYRYMREVGGTPWGLCPILCPTICVPFRVKFDLFWVCLTKKKPLNKEGLYVSQKWFLTSRGERIRTFDLLLPKQVLIKYPILEKT